MNALSTQLLVENPSEEAAGHCILRGAAWPCDRAFANPSCRGHGIDRFVSAHRAGIIFGQSTCVLP